MCNITKRIKAIDVREKRLDIRRKLQHSLITPIQRKISELSDETFHEKQLSYLSGSHLTADSEDDSPKMTKTAGSDDQFEFFQKYEILSKLGQGANSTVFKCVEKKSNELFAVKVTKHRDDQFVLDSKNKFQIIRCLQHDSIIKSKKYFLNNTKMTTYVVQEYCQFKNLKEIIHDRAEKKFSQIESLRILKSILEALKYLNEYGICHRDIKPQNILYNPENGKIKIIDLDCSKKKKETEDQFQMWTKSGTLNYQAPQYFLQASHTQKVDTWAVGVIGYELLTGVLPFFNPYYAATVKLIVSKELNFESLNVSESTKMLLKGLLQRSPVQRYSASDAFQNCSEIIKQLTKQAY